MYSGPIQAAMSFRLVMYSGPIQAAMSFRLKLEGMAITLDLHIDRGEHFPPN